jgi:uncharacterized protein YndB with AHSA1/START domain
MPENLTAKVSITINAPGDAVWDALVNPAVIKQYMFGSDVVSSWKEGSPIYFRGEWKGKPYEDKGVILGLVPGKLLEYTHYSPLSGLADLPENYHLVTIELSKTASGVVVTLSQDNNGNEEEKGHSEKNWMMMLEGMKKVVEGKERSNS